MFCYDYCIINFHVLCRIKYLNLNLNLCATAKTHNTELQLVKIHINNIKHITVANVYIPPRDTTSTYVNTLESLIQTLYI